MTLNNAALLKTDLFQRLITNMPMIFYVLDLGRHFVLSEGKGLAQLGLIPGQVIGLSAKDMYKDFPAIIDSIERTFKGENCIAELQIGGLYLESYMVPIYDDAGNIEGIAGSTIDITSRMTAEAQLKELNLSLEKIVTQRTEALQAANEELIATNEELVALNEEMTAMNDELVDSNDKLKQLQSYLVESEKMAALGSLVTGVAHEINTPIGVAVTAASYLNELTDELFTISGEKANNNETFSEHLNDISEASKIVLKNLERASRLVQSFKQLSVDQSSEPLRSFELHSYLEDVILSLSPSLRRSTVDIQIECPKKITMKSYPGAFAQIITQLVMNAYVHGFKDELSGSITIALDEKDGVVHMMFKDTGVGMNANTLSRIFEPFFTTKRSFGGSGLGLSIVYSLVTQTFNGTIHCDSKEKIGTTFFITLMQGDSNGKQ